MTSLRMSFCVARLSRSSGRPCRPATATYIARITAAGALIAFAGLACSSGVSSKTVSRGRRELPRTPTLPAPPPAGAGARGGCGGRVPGVRGEVHRHVAPAEPPLEHVAEAAVGLRRGAEARVLAHRPEPPAVHGRVDAARERVRAGGAEVARDVEPPRGEVRGRVRALPAPRRPPAPAPPQPAPPPPPA